MIIDVNKSKQENAIRPSLIDRCMWKAEGGQVSTFAFRQAPFNGFQAILTHSLKQLLCIIIF